MVSQISCSHSIYLSASNECELLDVRKRFAPRLELVHSVCEYWLPVLTLCGSFPILLVVSSFLVSCSEGRKKCVLPKILGGGRGIAERGLPRKYWVIYKGPGLLDVQWFGSPPSPVSKLSQFSWGWERSQIMRRRESLVLYKSFSTLWVYPIILRHKSLLLWMLCTTFIEKLCVCDFWIYNTSKDVLKTALPGPYVTTIKAALYCRLKKYFTMNFGFIYFDLLQLHQHVQFCKKRRE